MILTIRCCILMFGIGILSGQFLFGHHSPPMTLLGIVIVLWMAVDIAKMAGDSLSSYRSAPATVPAVAPGRKKKPTSKSSSSSSGSNIAFVETAKRQGEK